MAAPPYASRASAVPVGHPNGGSVSPRTQVVPKNVAFELLFPESPQTRARLPLRVQIYPHDTTDSIVTTVKNFYGLYSGPTVSKGVSFEDDQGNTLIARYENFRDNMVVYVRVFEEAAPSPGTFAAHPYQPAVFNGDGYPAQTPHAFAHHIARPTSRTSRIRSPSPNGRERRSTSAGTNPGTGKKGRSQISASRASGSQSGHDNHGDALNGYTSGDGAPGSSSSKSKDHLGNTEISLENIVEGGRRKRAKFESSELPLFAPPQMPAATSNPSISPVRRAENHRQSLPHIQFGQHAFAHPRPMQSPQSYNNGFGYSSLYATPTSEQQRSRNSIGYPPAITPGAGILPTPDPTVGSCVSEEDKDVALQLMRLGEMSNISQGRTSASTLDDTFSGRADAASSTGATSDSESEGEDDLPPARRQRLDMSGNHQKILPTTEGHFAPRQSIETDDPVHHTPAIQGLMGAPKAKTPKPKADSTHAVKSRPQQHPAAKTAKSLKPTAAKPKVKKATSESGAVVPNVPGLMSPASLPVSRKQSVVSSAAMPSASGEDEPDLSTKPRCQRCRKSKKGCDRQRPCGRCKDAGIPADQCVSEDEGNGRKGRYGRHMGVPLKTAEMPAPPALLPAAPITTANAPVAAAAAAPASAAAAAAAAAAVAAANADKSKKRKR